MAVALQGPVGQTSTTGVTQIDLTITDTVAPSVSGAGTCLIIFVVLGYTNLSDGTPLDSSLGDPFDNVADPGTGAPPNTYLVDSGPCDGLPGSQCSGSSGPVYSVDGGQQGSTFVQVIQVKSTWGYKIGDVITIPLTDTFIWEAAYAYAYTGSGINPSFFNGEWQVAYGVGTEAGFDATYDGSALAPYTYADIDQDPEMICLTIMQGAGQAFLLDGDWQVPGTVVEDGDAIDDVLGVWTEQTGVSIPPPDLDFDTACVYRIWTQTYPGGAQMADAIAQFQSDPSRRATVDDVPKSPVSGIYWMGIKDLVPPPDSPVFNHHFRVAE